MQIHPVVLDEKIKQKIPVGLVAELVKRLPEEAVAVLPFGSALYGTETANSDLDIVVLTLPSLWSVAFCEKPSASQFRWNPAYGLWDISKSTGEIRPVSSSKDTIEIRILCVSELISGFSVGTPLCVEVMSFFKGFYESEGELATIRGSRFEPVLETLIWIGSQFEAINVFPILEFAKKNKNFVKERAHKLRAYQFLEKYLRETFQEKDRSTELVTPSLAKTLHEAGSQDGLPPAITINDNGEFFLFKKPVNHKWTVLNLYNHVLAKLREYGDRTVLASEIGFDAKGVIHSLRCLWEVQDILTQGYITFPMRKAPILTELKLGARSNEFMMELFEREYKATVEMIGDISGYNALLEKVSVDMRLRIPGIMVSLYQKLVMKEVENYILQSLSSELESLT